MTKTSLTLVFVGWMVANLVAYVVLLFSDRPGWTRGAEAFCKLSRWLVGAVFLVVIAEGWWQETLLHFSAWSTSALTVPIQDHGVKYVSPHDAGIIGFFGTLFYLVPLPFLALFVGEIARKNVGKSSAEGRHGGVSS